MSNLNTELVKALAQGNSIEEVFRQQLETAMNDLLQTEMVEFIGYERYSPEGYGSGDNRNGFYSREFKTKYGALKLSVPRDRNGQFKQHTLPARKRSDDALETTVIQLYEKGITTREIADIIEKMYGQHYSAQTVSNISKAVQSQVEQFHSRQVEENYAVIYCDATYVSLRRDSVAKEAIHVVMGITPDGRKEILDYAIYPSESAAHYEEMLANLKERGLNNILLVVTDGLVGMREAVARQFPKAKYQKCWVHIARTVASIVRKAARKEALADLKTVYQQDAADSAGKELDNFVGKYGSKYPRIAKLFGDRDGLFAFYGFPKAIRKSIYTTNIIENNNKGLKHKTKRKEQFPNEQSLESFVCCYYSEYNRCWSNRSHPGFKDAESELLSMLDMIS